MPTAYELLSNTLEDVLVVDFPSKTIKIPSGVTNIGVESDDETTILNFKMSRYKSGIDLKGFVVRINYTNANGEGDVYTAKDVITDNEFITFSWEVGRFAVMYKGNVNFIVCAKKFASDGVTVDKEFNTTVATLPVLEGLETEQSVVESQPDAIASAAYEAILLALDSDLKGDPGYTPIKGTDYYTPEEREEFLNEVILGAKASYANSFTNDVSGEVIRVEDVSPIEHSPEVSIHGKNFFDISKIAITTSPVNAIISEVGEDYIIITTNDGYTGNGFSTTTQKLKEVCPGLKIGKTYVLSAITESNSTNIYFSGIAKSWVFGKAMVMTEELLNSALTFYGLSEMHGFGTGDCRISNIQIEEGTVATEYEPYIDPSTVTLIRCGKNILGYADSFSITQDGISIDYDANEQIFTVNGTPEKASFPINFGSHLFDKLSLPIGLDVALSIEHISGTLSAESSSNVFYLGNSDSPGGGRNNWFSVPFPTSNKKTNVSTATKKYFTHTWLYIGGEYNVTFTNYKFKVQLEIGNEATNYEKFVGAKCTPTTDGLVDISTVSPTMTLFTNTPGVTIDCIYNRDTNAVMGDFSSALAELHNYAQGVISGGAST